MKHRKLWMGVLLIGILLLSACSGGDAPIDPSIPSGESITQESEPLKESSVDESSVDETAVPDQIEPTTHPDYSEYEIITLLPPDGIPALTNPSYYNTSHADEEYDPDEIVLGIVFNGDARAYSISLLSSHEIVNDTVGGIPLAVTW